METNVNNTTEPQHDAKLPVMPRLITEKDVINFITHGEATDYILKNYFRNYDNSHELYEVIDNLIYDEKIFREYTKESQVPFYRVNNEV